MFYDGARLSWANRRVQSPNVVFGEVMYQPGGFCGPRVQRDFELVVLYSGDCRVKVGRVAHHLVAGTVYLFRPGVRETFRFADQRATHHAYCSVHPRLVPAGMESGLAAAPFAVPQTEVFRLLLAAAFRLRTPRGATACRVIEQLGLCLLAEFLEAAEAARSPSARDQAVQAFLHFVEDHFGEESCLREAHKVAGVSRNTLISRLRQELDTTPARHIWRYRVERGAAMLAETGHTVAEIAYRCGFKNPFHFSRLASQLLGESPRRIRLRAWGSADGAELPRPAIS